MEKDVVILKCKECGEEFLYEYSGRGKKPEYCTKCKQIVVQRSKQKYIDKQKELKLNIVVPPTNVSCANELSTYDDFIQQIKIKLNAIDTIRVDLCNLASNLHKYQSAYDKDDQVYMHTLENLDTTNLVETQKFISEWKKSRNNRRSVKDLITLVSDTIESLPYKCLYNAMPVLKKENYVRRIDNDTRGTNLYVTKQIK